MAERSVMTARGNVLPAMACHSRATAVRAAQAEAVKFNLMAGTQAPPTRQQDDAAATLRHLVSLHDEGLLADEEFAARRAEVIARIQGGELTVTTAART